MSSTVHRVLFVGALLILAICTGGILYCFIGGGYAISIAILLFCGCLGQFWPESE